LTPLTPTCSVRVMDEDFPKTLLELERRFSTEEACAEYFALCVGRTGGFVPGALVLMLCRSGGIASLRQLPV